MKSSILSLLLGGLLFVHFDVQAMTEIANPSQSVISDRDYVVLQKNKSFKEQVGRPNTTYEIRYCYDLGKEKVSLPKGCILKFSGGVIDNGIIHGNDSAIEAGNVQIFGRNLLMTGYWSTNALNVCWFGAKNDITYNSSQAFKAANNSAWSIIDKKKEYEYYGETNTINIVIPTGVYYVSGNDILGSTREEHSFPNYNTNVLYRVEGNNSIIYWEVTRKEDNLFRFDYSIGHQTISNLKIYVVNNCKTEEYAGVVFKVGNLEPHTKVPSRVYDDAGSSHYNDIQVSNSRKGNGGIFKVFNVIGRGQCDQALVQRCSFDSFLYGFYNTNAEAVSWSFESCSFFSDADGAHYFYIKRLNQYLMVNNSTFSYFDGQTLCEYDCELNDKGKLLGNDRDNIVFNNTRFEGYQRYNKDWFVVYKGTAGKLIMQNCNFDASSSYKITHRFLLSDLGSVYMTNCAMAKALFTIPRFTSRSYGLGDQNSWAIVTDNLRCDDLDFKGYDWDKDKLISITDSYLTKGVYYRFADFKDFKGKSSKGFKQQSFYILPNSVGEAQYDEKSISFVLGNSSIGSDILLPPFCIVKKIELYDMQPVSSAINRIRIYAGGKNSGVYTDVAIENHRRFVPLSIIFEGSIVVFDEDINKQVLHFSYITDQGKEINARSGTVLISYTPLTDPSVFSLKKPSSVIIEE